MQHTIPMSADGSYPLIKHAPRVLTIKDDFHVYSVAQGIVATQAELAKRSPEERKMWYDSERQSDAQTPIRRPVEKLVTVNQYIKRDPHIYNEREDFGHPGVTENMLRRMALQDEDRLRIEAANAKAEAQR